MLPLPRPHGQVNADLDQVNDDIRRLMDQPPTPERTIQYRRLLEKWARVSGESYATAA